MGPLDAQGIQERAQVLDVVGQAAAAAPRSRPSAGSAAARENRGRGSGSARPEAARCGAQWAIDMAIPFRKTSVSSPLPVRSYWSSVPLTVARGTAISPGRS